MIKKFEMETDRIDVPLSLERAWMIASHPFFAHRASWGGTSVHGVNKRNLTIIWAKTSGRTLLMSLTMGPEDAQFRASLYANTSLEICQGVVRMLKEVGVICVWTVKPQYIWDLEERFHL